MLTLMMTMFQMAVANPSRISFEAGGGGGLNHDAPIVGYAPRVVATGCGDMGLRAVIDEKRRRRPRRAGPLWGLRPVQTTFVFHFYDFCAGIGAGTESWMLGFMPLGVGAQWGGDLLYLNTEITAAFSGYGESEGPGNYGIFGVLGRPKASLGLQLGAIAIEAGGSVRSILPLYTSIHNGPLEGRFKAITTFDVAVLIGDGSPRFRKRRRHRRARAHRQG